MIAPLSACDLFMSPIKLLSPHIAVKARHQRSEEDGGGYDGGTPPLRSSALKKGACVCVGGGG